MPEYTIIVDMLLDIADQGSHIAEQLVGAPGAPYTPTIHASVIESSRLEVFYIRKQRGRYDDVHTNFCR